MNVSHILWTLSSLMGVGSAIAVAGVSCTSTREPSAEQQLLDLRDDELYGDLESGVDSSLWVDDGFDEGNPLDMGLSESPYRDFDPVDSSLNEKPAALGKRKLRKASKKEGQLGTKSAVQGGKDWWSQ